jgi:hypothetical protein
MEEMGLTAHNTTWERWDSLPTIPHGRDGTHGPQYHMEEMGLTAHNTTWKRWDSGPQYHMEEMGLTAHNATSLISVYVTFYELYLSRLP